MCVCVCVCGRGGTISFKEYHRFAQSKDITHRIAASAPQWNT
jgi:hypothetical protein